MTGDADSIADLAGKRVSIHARRVTGDELAGDKEKNERVSIHARRVTGDSALALSVLNDIVSIHARRVTGDSQSYFCAP